MSEFFTIKNTNIEYVHNFELILTSAGQPVAHAAKIDFPPIQFVFAHNCPLLSGAQAVSEGIIRPIVDTSDTSWNLAMGFLARGLQIQTSTC